MIDLKKKFKDSDLREFAEFVQDISYGVGFKLSARGWAYELETKRLINKDEFDKVNNLINKCRKVGYLPIDFVAEDEVRSFKGVESPTRQSVVDEFAGWLRGAKDTPEYYTPDWWDGEEYYIQMVVEKVDLVTLFKPVCDDYHIPIANSKGWSSMLQRAEYALRFAEAENKNLKCVLLYCGDHDPDGLRISEFIRKNLEDLKDVTWDGGSIGYDPEDLTIDRFGLNYDFIEEHNLTWIDNLITGSKKRLDDPNHKNYHHKYVQDYLRTIGVRKCEANAIVTIPDDARDLARDSIEKYVGSGAIDRFEIKRQEIRDEFNDFLRKTGFGEEIDKVIDAVENRD